MNHQLSQKIIKAFCETENFFTIGPKITTSNRITPIYPDPRRVFSDPRSIKLIAEEIVDFINEKKIKVDFIVGGATAGISLATVVGLAMGKPFGYVRKEPKDGGMGLALEGNYCKGMRAVLVDDAMGHGKAKAKFIENIRKAGLKIDWVIVPFSRTNRGKSGRECAWWVKKYRVKFQSFADVYTMNEYCLKHKIITPEAVTLLKWYAEDAEGWNKNKKKWEFFQEYLKMKKHDSKSGV